MEKIKNKNCPDNLNCYTTVVAYRKVPYKKRVYT